MCVYVCERVLGHVFASRFNGDNNFFRFSIFVSFGVFFFHSVLCCLCGALGKLCNITISTQRPATTRAAVTATKTTTSAQQKVIMIIIIKASPCRVGFSAVALVALFTTPPSPLFRSLRVKPANPKHQNAAVLCRLVLTLPGT